MDTPISFFSFFIILKSRKRGGNVEGEVLLNVKLIWIGTEQKTKSIINEQIINNKMGKE